MVQTIKSVLLIDYDSIFESLDAAAPGTGDLIGSRAGVWLDAIESGAIVEATMAEAVRRRFQSKRCYASPEVVGKNRGWLTANGIQVVDCAAPSGLYRGAGDIHLVLDALDAGESEPDEIILLTAGTDLTPLLFRLRALNVQLLIFGTDETASSYKTFADGYVDQARMIDALTRPAEESVLADKGSIPRPPRIDAPQRRPAVKSQAAERPQPRPLAASRQPVDREAMAALVRRIHEATNVPLFSPRAFADLFRFLAEEIREKGYKFQANADHVAAAMNNAGRNVNKRQVGFVIKGLTLRGHVFSADDTPEVLAEAFRQQVLYLIANAKLELSEEEQDLVEAWIVGPPGEGSADAPAGGSRVRSDDVEREQNEAAAKPRSGSRRVGGRRRAEPEDGRAADEPPRSRAPRRSAERGPLRAASRPVRVVDAPSPDEDLRASSSFASRVGRNGAEPPRRQHRAPARSEPPAELEADLEDSILSAIADAVDVLADDQTTPMSPDEDDLPTPTPREGSDETDRAARESDVDDEIGDEIQRILATYSDRR